MVKVLFVCLGNICRSPLAEGILLDQIEKSNLQGSITVDSCGTSNFHIGGLSDPRTRENAFSNGISLTHRARQFTKSDFTSFDYIYVMDQSNYRNVMALSENEQDAEKVALMRSFDSNEPNSDVPDPYYGGSDGFQNVFEILEHNCEHLLQYLRETHQL